MPDRAQEEERDRLAARLRGLAGTLTTQTALYGRDEATQVQEYTRRCQHAHEELNEIAGLLSSEAGPPRLTRAFLDAYDAWQVGKAQADVDDDWLRIAPLYDAMVEARAALADTETGAG